MKKQDIKARPPKLTPDNEAELEANKEDAEKMAVYDTLLTLIAQMFDGIANGENMYMIIGSTRAKDAFSLTIKGEDTPDPVYAETFVDLCEEAKAML